MKNDCIMLPGAFNGMSGRLAAENGTQTNKYIKYNYTFIIFSK